MLQKFITLIYDWRKTPKFYNYVLKLISITKNVVKMHEIETLAKTDALFRNINVLIF
jgi:hypothetical protein